MKMLVLSDLHLEHGHVFQVPEELDYDAVVLAGDIHSPGRRAVEWARQDSTFASKPVLLVPGNHEFYGREMGRELREMKKAADGSQVHVLDRTSAVIEGVRFLGCTLWTDFQLPVQLSDSTSLTTSDVSRALAEANRCLNDFRLVELQAPVRNEHRDRGLRRLLRAEDTLAMHWVDRDWLRRELKKPFSGLTIVVTHHAPAAGSVAQQYATDWLTPAFVSNLPDDLFSVPALWVHGHTHSSCDYPLGRCRVVSNPRGYRSRDGAFENDWFNSGFVVHLETSRSANPTGEAQKPPASAAELLDVAVKVLGSVPSAQEWLISPAISLNRRRPIDLLNTEEGRCELEDLLGRLEHDVYT